MKKFLLKKGRTYTIDADGAETVVKYTGSTYVHDRWMYEFEGSDKWFGYERHELAGAIVEFREFLASAT